MESKEGLSKIICSLSEEDKYIINSLHETAISHGYKAKISIVGKKADEFKCEYITTNPKRVFYTLVINGEDFYIRSKLLHISQYVDALESCTENIKSSLITASKNCRSNSKGCKGPISFIMDGKPYSKCRYSFRFKNLMMEDVESLRRLLQIEEKYSKKT